MEESVKPKPALAALGRARRYNELEDRGRRLRARCFSVLAALAGIGYLIALPRSLNPDAGVAATAFFVAELLFLAVFLLAVAHLWTVRFKPATGRPATEPHPVDVFIPVLGEPSATAERALTSAACLDWDGPVEVTVVDDSGSLELQLRTRELGISYLPLTRPGVHSRHTRSEALNRALAGTSGDLVLVLDPDQVVRPDALSVLAGYLELEDVAFVQPKSSRSTGPTPLLDLDDAVSDAIQSGADAANAVVARGPAVLYLRAALEDAGGFAPADRHEGPATSSVLHAKGWKSLHFPVALSDGQSPPDFASLYKQHATRVAGTMRGFFWENPLLRRDLGWRARLGGFLHGLAYLWIGIFLPILVLAPAWAFASGTPFLVEGAADIVGLRLFYFALFAMASRYLFLGRNPARQLRQRAGLFTAYSAGVMDGLLGPIGLDRRRSDSSRDATGRRLTRTLWLALTPQLLIVLANVLMPAVGLIRRTGSAWVAGATLGLSAAFLWLLWPTLRAALTSREGGRQVPAGPIVRARRTREVA